MSPFHPAVRALSGRSLSAASLLATRLSALPLSAMLLLAAGTEPSPGPDTVARSSADASELWYPPLGHPLRISAVYSLPNGPYRAGHRGVDFPAIPEQPVLAPAAGTVTFSGTVVDRPVVSIRVDERTVVSLEPVASPLREGETVSRGERIGEVSAGGHCTAGCLHLGVRRDHHYVNPLRFFRPKPVLLPWSAASASSAAWPMGSG